MNRWKRWLFVFAVCQSAGGCGSHDHGHEGDLDHATSEPAAVVNSASDGEVGQPASAPAR